MKVLRNYTEDAVRTYVERTLCDYDVCQCDDCRLDVMAIMLNNMKSHYVVTEKGALYAQLNDFDPQTKVDMMTNMGLAIQLVNYNPKH